MSDNISVKQLTDEEIKDIGFEVLPLEGEGGGGSRNPPPSQRASVEINDNQFSNIEAKVLVAYSSGETGGLINNGGIRRSVYFDDTQLESSTGFNSFSGVGVVETQGSDIQGPLQGYAQASSVTNVNTEVFSGGIGVVRTVGSADIDEVRIVMTIPALYKVFTNGDMKGNSVQIQLSYRDPAVGTWFSAGTYTISGKSSGPFQRQFSIPRPLSNPTSAWDWRVIRLTGDSVTSRWVGDTIVQSAVEIQYGNESYPGTAMVGMSFDVGEFGNNIPNISLRVSGVKVRVPSNYSETGGAGGTPLYTGIWNGSWVWASTSNPAWHLYHLITDDDVGLGLPEAYVDRYNFYEIARYNDAVDDTGVFVGVNDGEGGLRRRFTINTQIVGQKDGIEMLQDIASAMRSILYFGAGAIVLKQDSPRETARIVTNENVKNGHFVYSSTEARDRLTVAKVAYNDPDDNFYLKYTRFPEQEDWATDTNILRYGRNEVEVTKFGCNNEAEANAYARWLVYTSCNESKTVTFVGGPEFMLSRPGDVIEIADRRLAGAASLDQRYGGRIADGTLTTVVLDYPVELAVGETYSITIVSDDGVTLQKRNITTPAGTGVTTVTVDAPFTGTNPKKGNTWLIEGTDIAPQKFSIIHTERKEGLEVEVFGVFYDENKFAVVENTPTVVAKPYTKLNISDLLPPTALTYKIIPKNEEILGLVNTLVVGWTASLSTYAIKYRARWRRDFGPWSETVVFNTNQFEIYPVEEGDYEIEVYSMNVLGKQSVPLTDVHTIVYADIPLEWDGVPVALSAPIITNGPTFGGKNLVVTWDRNPLNDIPGIVFSKYKVNFTTSAPGQTYSYNFNTTNNEATYFYDRMLTAKGAGIPFREITANIYEIDSLGRQSLPATLLFTNPAPTAPTFNLRAGFDFVGVEINIPADEDIAGYFVFRSDTPTFTKDATTQVYKGVSASYVDGGLEVGKTYYYAVAAYDAFDEDVDAVAKSGELQVTTNTINSAITSFETEGIVFSVSGSTVSWTPGTVYSRVGNTLTPTATIAGNALWTSGKLYIYYDPDSGSILSNTNLATIYGSGTDRRVLATYNGTTLLQGTDEPIIDGANILAETIGATQVVTSGLITNSAQINDGLITSAKIGDAAITSAKIGDLEVTNAKIVNLTITGEKIGDFEVSRPKITSGAITKPGFTSAAGSFEFVGGEVGWQDAREFTPLHLYRYSLFIPIDEIAGDEPEEIQINRLSVVNQDSVFKRYTHLAQTHQDARLSNVTMESKAMIYVVPNSDFVTKNPNFPAPTTITPGAPLYDTVHAVGATEYREMLWSAFSEPPGTGITSTLTVNGGLLRGVQFYCCGGGGGGGANGGGGGGGGGVTTNRFSYDEDPDGVTASLTIGNTDERAHTLRAGGGGAADVLGGVRGTMGTRSTVQFFTDSVPLFYPQGTLTGRDYTKDNMDGLLIGSLGGWMYSRAAGGGGGGTFDGVNAREGGDGGCGGGQAGGKSSTLVGYGDETPNWNPVNHTLSAYLGGNGGRGSSSVDSGGGGGGGAYGSFCNFHFGNGGVGQSTTPGAGGLQDFDTLFGGDFVTSYNDWSSGAGLGGNGGSRQLTAPTGSPGDFGIVGPGGFGGNLNLTGGDGYGGIVIIRYPTDQESLRPYTAHLIGSAKKKFYNITSEEGEIAMISNLNTDSPSDGIVISRFDPAVPGTPKWNSGDTVEVRMHIRVNHEHMHNHSALFLNQDMEMTYVKFYK